jgi:hypothetical protein
VEELMHIINHLSLHFEHNTKKRAEMRVNELTDEIKAIKEKQPEAVIEQPHG